MSNQEMKNQIFEVILKAAIKESFENEVRAYPSADTLTEEYDLSLTTHRIIEKMIQDSHKKLAQLHIKKVAKKAAVIAAITIPVSIFGLFSVDASRNAIFNALLDWKADHIDIKYGDKQVTSSMTSSNLNSSIIKPQYLPDGFIETECSMSGSNYVIKYENNNGKTIILRRSLLPKEGTFAIDIENTERKEIKIKGEPAFLFVAKEPNKISYLAWKKQSYSYFLRADIKSDELVMIAESMQKNN